MVSRVAVTFAESVAASVVPVGIVAVESVSVARAVASVTGALASRSFAISWMAFKMAVPSMRMLVVFLSLPRATG